MDPEYVTFLVDQLTEEEAGQLATYACAGDGGMDYLVRTSEWLRKRFKLDRHTTS